MLTFAVPTRKLRAALPAALALVTLSAAPALRQRLEGWFQAWYPAVIRTRMAVTETRDISVPGYAVRKVERVSDSALPKAYQESGYTLVDTARGEVFVGDVLHDPQRVAAGRPFDPAADLPNMSASLQEAFRLPVRIDVKPDARPGSPGPSASAAPTLVPITVSVLQGGEADLRRPGFVSKDGATLLLGEFRRLADPPAAWRERELAARPGVHLSSGSFTASEFLDFQCERCRVRTPEARRAVAERGGTLEVRFFPLSGAHEWAFAAAESGAALAGASVAAYEQYEKAIFARGEGMDAAGARQIAADAADAAGVRQAYESELSSGRARERVLSDMQLGIRIGVTGTPTFVLDGLLVPGPRGMLENALFLSRGKPAGKPAPPPTLPPGERRP